MSDFIPRPILQALDQGIEYFMDQNHEWKLEVEQNIKHIEEHLGTRVYVFANNGYGDFFFLKLKAEGPGFEETVYEFLHEGPSTTPAAEDLETLIGLKARPPSTDDFPQAVYRSGEAVLPGDQVKFRSWLQFWKGWQKAEVKYVPGISNLDFKYEYSGLKLVEVANENMSMGVFVDPHTGILKKLRFVKRKS